MDSMRARAPRAATLRCGIRRGRRLLGALAASLLLMPLLAAASDGPVRLLVGFPAGGGTDAIARTLAEGLKEELGVPVVVDNRPGAGGQLAAQALKAAPPDGSTVFISHDHTVSILPLVVKNPGFDPSRDFVAVAGFATFVNAFAVSRDTPARSLAEYAAWVKTARGGQDAVGIPAPASVPEFLVQALARRHQLDLVAAPYRGSAPMMADMLGNQIAAGVGSVPDLIEQHRSGGVRIVAVMGRERQAVLPDVPTLAESGLAGFEALPYYGFFAPIGTPPAAIERFSAALMKVIARPAVRERLTALGLAVEPMPQAVLAARVRAYSADWARLIQASGFEPR